MTALVVVEGDVIDPADGSELFEAVCAAVRLQPSGVQVDLSGVDLLGSAGINGLLRAYRAAQRLGCPVTVIAATPLVRRVLEVMSLAALFGMNEG